MTPEFLTFLLVSACLSYILLILLLCLVLHSLLLSSASPHPLASSPPSPLSLLTSPFTPPPLLLCLLLSGSDSAVRCGETTVRRLRRESGRSPLIRRGIGSRRRQSMPCQVSPAMKAACISNGVHESSTSALLSVTQHLILLINTVD